MARQPVPGGDNGQWGSILNTYLSVSLNTDGTVNPGVIGSSQIASGAVGASQANLSSLANGMMLSGTLAGRPAAAASNSGFYYLATDTGSGTLYQSNGTSWSQVTSGVLHAARHASGGADPITPSSIGAEATANKDQANGYAGLDSSGLIKSAELPAALIKDSSGTGGSLPVKSSLAARPGQIGLHGAPTLPLVSPLTLRQRTRNDFVNPRANPVTNGWCKVDIAGSTGVTFTGITNDPDLGYCAQYQATTTGPGTVQIGIGTTSIASPNPKTWGAAIDPGQLLFARVSVKMTQQGSATACPAYLWAGIFTNSNVQVSSRPIASKPTGIPLNSVVTLEGIEVGGSGCSWAMLQATFSVPSAGTWTFVVGRPQMVVDPDGRVPNYVDGSMWNGSWQSTTDNSPSDGWAPPATPPTPWYSGFNDNALTQSNLTGNQVLSAAEDVGLMLEAGATHWRGGIVLGNVWPTNSGSPNWRNWALASFMDDLAAAGLNALPIIGAPTTWMTTDSSGNANKLDFINYRSQWLQLWTSFVQTWPTVINAVEFGNEPNITAGWNIPAASYTTWLQALYPAIKGVNSQITVLGGALSQYQNNDANGTPPGTYLSSMYSNGAKGYMDAISVHPYPSDLSTANPIGGASGFSAGFDPVMGQIRTAKTNAGDANLPIWITEVTAEPATITERQQAVYMNLLTGINQRSGDVQAQFMHTLTPDTTIPTNERYMAAVEYVTLRRKPVFDALRSGFVPERTDPPWFPAQNALVLATFDPIYAVANAYQPGTGYIIVTKIWVPRTVIATNLICMVNTVGSGLTANQNLLGIYSPSGQLLGQTADQSSAWTSAGEKVAAISGGPITIPGGPGRWVWAAILSNGTTAPKFSGLSSAPNFGLNEDAVAQVPGARYRVGYENAGARTSLISLAGLLINPVYSGALLIGIN